MRTETIQIQLQGKATGAVLQTYFMDASKELLNSTRRPAGRLFCACSQKRRVRRSHGKWEGDMLYFSYSRETEAGRKASGSWRGKVC